MRHVLVFILVSAFLTPLHSQYVLTWDPDADGDNLITVNDLLALLSVFEEADSDDDGIFDSMDDCIGVYDACGVCGGVGVDADLDGICDDIDPCVGTYDVVGVCGGSCTADADADGVCDTNDPCVGALDACGVCNGPGAVYTCGCADIPAGDCDCAGNALDALGVCGGLCVADADADGVCDNVDPCVGVLDVCGLCNGPGPSIPVIDSIVFVTDSVYLPPLSSWYVFTYAVDTLYTYVCPTLGCMDSAASNFNPDAQIENGSCTYGPAQCGGQTHVVFDGYSYELVAIGSQCWFKENLQSDQYRNGDAIPGGLTNANWTSTTSGAQAAYSESSGNMTLYGRLYNGYAVSDLRGICPAGFHVPTDSEWMILETALGLTVNQANATGWRGSNQGAQLKATATDSPSWNGSNTSEFSALPGGYRNAYGNFALMGSSGYWWSASPNGVNFWSRLLSSDYSSINRSSNHRQFGYSVRCVKDSQPIVDTQPAAGVTATTANLSANLLSAGGSSVSSTGFKYASNSSLLGALTVVGSGTSSSITAVLSGLAPGGTYWVVGFATNAMGTSFGDTISFNTYVSVDTQAATSVTATSATLNGVLSNSGGGVVNATGFKYATNAALVGGAASIGSGTLAQFSAQLSGLAPGTQYWAVAYAVNAAGTSYGDTITFMTSASAPTVDTQAASSVTATSATLNATFMNGSSAVTATGFKYATNAALTSPTDVAGSGTTSPFTGSLMGLTASTQYWVVAYATNAVGTSYGDTIAFTTSAAPLFTCGTSTVNYDGHNYTTVQIGTQCWFAENLRNDNYRNGDAIPGNLSYSQWSSTGSGAQALYNNASGSLTTDGRLYNWYAVDDSRGLCPYGFHVPSDWEWALLENALGGSSIAGNALKSTAPAWNGTNSSGFSALPGGYRNLNGVFGDRYVSGYWWTSSISWTDAWYRRLDSEGLTVYRNDNYLRYGFSVRCVRD
jgi:uncharacterized protein (TIGR02145 family)